MKKNGTPERADATRGGPEQDPSAEVTASQSWIEHPTTVRWLQVLVVVLGGVLMIGFAAVIGRIAYLALMPPETQAPVQATMTVRLPAQGSGASATLAAERTIPLPKGAIVKSVAPSDGGIFVHFEDTRGSGGILFDPTTGEIKRRWRFSAD